MGVDLPLISQVCYILFEWLSITLNLISLSGDIC